MQCFQFSRNFKAVSYAAPLQDMQPQIMTVTGCFIVGVKHSGNQASPGLQ